MKVKKIPQRKCVGCNEMKDKKALLRIVRSPEGEISLDLTGRRTVEALMCAPVRRALPRRLKKNA